MRGVWNRCAESCSYVYYRNYVRGHLALGGKPSITRRKQHDRLASQELLDRLERFARYELKRKVVSRYGYIPVVGRVAYVGRAWRQREITLVETLEGLEAQIEGQCVAIMTAYWKFRKLPSWERGAIPPRLYFRPYERATCPRMAVAP